MDDLKHCSLDELIERVIQESLIDSCEQKDDHVIIVQGSTRFVLNPKRAHAFLRGVIKGMSTRYPRCARKVSDTMLDGGRASGDESPPTALVGSFRRHLLTKWWSRYEDAKCPFGRSSTGLMLWVRHNTHTTAN